MKGKFYMDLGSKEVMCEEHWKIIAEDYGAVFDPTEHGEGGEEEQIWQEVVYLDGVGWRPKDEVEP